MSEANRNLLLRVVTALVLLPGVLWLIWRGGLPFAALIALAAGASALEVNSLPWAPREAGAPEPQGRALSLSLMASVAVAALMPLVAEAPQPLLTPQGLIAALAIVSLCDALFFEPQLDLAPRRVGLSLLGACWPGVLLASLVTLRQKPHGVGWIVLALSATWLNDTGGYFAGRFFGRHKLFPRVSPKKTWEGFAGGMAASIAGSVVVQQLFIPELAPWAAAIVGAGASLLGPLGDLSESLLKRAFGAKDSGRLLPGHGGMLDRLDALCFTAPYVLLCARVFVG
jgi:phosphatidate cytidylyltransferase